MANCTITAAAVEHAQQIDRSASSECPQNCSDFLKISGKTIPKSTLSQHFKALGRAGLIRGERVGVEMRNNSRCAEIDKRFSGLISAIVKAHKMQSAEDARRRKRKTRRAR